MKNYSHIYFLGIGGIGMSAIARYYTRKGFKVSGYDLTPSQLTAELQAEGIEVHYDDNPSLIPADTASTLIVYTPAIPKELKEYQHVINNGYKTVKRSRMLGEITEGQKCLAVAGTHGKTTTSTLVAHILTESGEGCSAFLGGISKNYNTNLLVSRNKLVVTEADEFDRSFLQLHPSIAVITAMDADHLDIYGDIQHYQDAFRDFAAQVSDSLIIKYGLPVTGKDTGARIFTYHLSEPKADFRAENMHIDSFGHYTYDLCHPGGIIKDIRVGTLGALNVENSIAAAAVCLLHGTDAGKIRHAIGTYAGVKRRMEEHINKENITYIDDYAHHPNELKAAISSLKEMFPKRKITGVFQPHLYSRTRDFAPEFANALSLLDKLILLDIYPAREEPIPGISSETIFKDVNSKEKVLIKKEELMDYLSREALDVLVTFGAGNIDRFVKPICEMLSK